MPTYFKNGNVGSIFLGDSLGGRAYLGTSLIASSKGRDWKGFRFTAIEDNSTITMQKVGSNPPSVQLEASLDHGDTWTSFVPGETTISLPHVGDTVFIRAQGGAYNERFNEPNGFKNYNSFSGEGKVSASGNINTIITKSGKVDAIVESGLRNLFNGMTSLVDAS